MLVWEQDLGERAARADHAVLWDGRNAAGNLVASGIYHLLLEARRHSGQALAGGGARLKDSTGAALPASRHQRGVSYFMILTLAIGILVSTVNNHAATPTQRSPAALRCGTPYLLQAMDASTEHQRLKLVQHRPSTQHSLLTPAGHFRVHYDTEGSNAVDLADDDGNGIPDYIDLAATVLDSIWVLEVEQLGYNPPPSDNGLGGGDEYDVYVTDLARGGGCGLPDPLYGCAYPGTSGATTYSHLEIDNNFTDSSYVQTRGLDALRVTIAHEFHHAIQFGYYAHRAGNWWQESTSTWMEEVAYPHTDDYLQYLTFFLGEPQRALNSGRLGTNHTYGSAIFSHFLDQRYSRELNRLIWEEVGRRKSIDLDHFDRVIRQVEPGGLGVVMGEFAVWNYFTGTRHRDQYYAAGNKYPSVLTRDMDVSTAVVRDTSLIDATGSVYLRLQPQLRQGGVDLFLDSIRGAWRRHLLLVGPDTVSVQFVSEPTIRISGWDQFDEIVLVASSAERTGFGLSAPIYRAIRPQPNRPAGRPRHPAQAQLPQPVPPRPTPAHSAGV